jgi:hypothetical protein
MRTCPENYAELSAHYLINNDILLHVFRTSCTHYCGDLIKQVDHLEIRSSGHRLIVERTVVQSHFLFFFDKIKRKQTSV